MSTDADAVRILPVMEWTHETTMAITLAYWRADRAGGAEALAAAMMAAETRHGHGAALEAFHMFDQLKADARRARAIDALAAAMSRDYV